MPFLVAIKGALLAAVGFEILKVVGTYTIAKSAKSPTLGPFAGLLAVLIWIQLVARLLLFCAALTATLTLGEVPRCRGRRGARSGSCRCTWSGGCSAARPVADRVGRDRRGAARLADDRPAV